MNKTAFFSLTGLALLVSACGGERTYWERISAPDAIYMRGPDARVLLEKDLAQCSCEVAKRASVPPAGTVNAQDGLTCPPAHATETLEPGGDDRGFEACMNGRGWRRATCCQ